MEASSLPALDAGSSLWLGKIQEATMSNTTCAVPPKYFSVLSAWGYIEGAATAAKLSATGLAQCIADQEAAKKEKKAKPTKKKRK